MGDSLPRHPKVNHRIAIPGIVLLSQLWCLAQTENWSVPLDDLPPNVQFTPGKFSVFADFDAHKEGDPLVLLLINDTDTELILPAQDGDVFLKQEAKVDGKWVRSEPHRYSWCGTSYMLAQPILPRHFVRYPAGYSGWVPPVGAPIAETPQIRTVRYRFYWPDLFRGLLGVLDATSNEGEFLVYDSLIEKAQFDSMALESAPLETLTKVIRGEIRIEPLDHIAPRTQAIRSLERFPGAPEAQEALLKVIEDTQEIESASPEQRVNWMWAREVALGLVAKVFNPDDAWEVYLRLLEDPDYPNRSTALRHLIEDLPERANRKTALLDSYLRSKDHPLWLDALRLRCNYWDRETERSKLKALLHELDSARMREEVRSLY